MMYRLIIVIPNYISIWVDNILGQRACTYNYRYRYISYSTNLAIDVFVEKINIGIFGELANSSLDFKCRLPFLSTFDEYFIARSFVLIL